MAITAGRGAERTKLENKEKGESTPHMVAAVCRIQQGLAAAQLFSHGKSQPSSSVF